MVLEKSEIGPATPALINRTSAALGVDFNTSTKIANCECHAEGMLLIVFNKDFAIEIKTFFNRNEIF